MSAPVVIPGLIASGALLDVFVQMFVTASTIRRIQDLNQRGWWIILFPFGLISLMWSFILVPMIAAPQLMAVMLVNPLLMLPAVQSLGCLILLIRLLVKRGDDPGNRYGPPVIPRDRGYLPA